MTRPIPSEQPNITEDEDGKCSSSSKKKVHMSPSVPQIILQEVPVPPPRVQPAQPTRVDTEGPSSNLISRGKKNPSPQFVLAAKLQKVHEENAVTHQIYGIDQEHRHLIKGHDRKIW